MSSVEELIEGLSGGYILGDKAYDKKRINGEDKRSRDEGS